MGAVIQFVLALAVFGVTVSGGSLVWPKITRVPRPEVLQQVHDVVVRTPQGAAMAQVLGVTDENNIEPVNMNEVAGGVWDEIKKAAEKRAQAIMMAQVTQQLKNQYEKLPEDQQQELQEIICKPSGMVQ